jgi:low temperature requirement protein LtrA
MWWAYFDVVAVVAEQRFSEAVGRDQLLIARDAYALLHLPMIVGSCSSRSASRRCSSTPATRSRTMPADALCGGLALYLLAHVGFRLRNVGSVAWHRLLVAGLMLAAIPLALELPGVATLAVLLAVWIGLIGYEVVHYREARARVRAARIGR